MFSNTFLLDLDPDDGVGEKVADPVTSRHLAHKFQKVQFRIKRNSSKKRIKVSVPKETSEAQMDLFQSDVIDAYDA